MTAPKPKARPVPTPPKTKPISIVESEKKVVQKNSRKSPREHKTKRKFVKKDKVYICKNAAGEAFKIYANDEADAQKIFTGIHKEPAVSMVEQRRRFRRKPNLTDRPFQNLDKIVNEEKK